LTISSSSTMDLADANARGVIFSKGSIRPAGSRHIVQTIASPYIGELGTAAPRPVLGTPWLSSR
jgi:hypothetical protein